MSSSDQWAAVAFGFAVAEFALVAVPFSEKLCVAPAMLRLLSVSVSEPVIRPVVVGAKLIGSRQLEPAASVPAVEDEGVRSGQSPAPPLVRVKFVVMAGLFPVAGTGKVNGAFPS